MKAFHAGKLRCTLIGLFCISTLLGWSASSVAGGSNMHPEGIQSATGLSSQIVTPQGLGTLDPAERVMLQNSRGTTAVSPPTLATIAPDSRWSAVFPIVGLIAAVTLTQLLRRRRIAQLRSTSSTGQ